jgi:hypothetical protein
MPVTELVLRGRREHSPVDRPHDPEAGGPGLATREELVRGRVQGGEEGALLELCGSGGKGELSTRVGGRAFLSC